MTPLIQYLCITVYFTLAGCKGQAATRPANGYLSVHAIALGDTVKQLANNIMLVYQDKHNVYWFGSWEDGLYKYDGKTLLHFTAKDGLPTNRINEIKEDRLGNIYFNTSGGISRYDERSFTTLRESKSVGNEWKLNPDDLWFTHPQFTGEVYRYDGKNLFKLAMPHTKSGDEFSTKYPSAWSGAGVYSIYKDSHGNIWFGTYPAGVCRYNGTSFDWIEEEDVTEYHNGPANGVRSIIEDKDGYFWFNSAYKYQVYKNTYSTNNYSSTQPFYAREKSIGSLDGNPEGELVEYLSIAKDNQNDLWFATYGNGVWRYSAGQQSGTEINVTYYPVQDKEEDITLFSIYKDHQGSLWLGTHEHGAYMFNGKSFERFHPKLNN